jgi:hypothetical protein
MPLLTKDPWFGPRRMPGWGWRPVKWQGWALSGGFLAAVILGGEFLHGFTKAAVLIPLVVVFVAVCALTGTKPGWRS